MDRSGIEHDMIVSTAFEVSPGIPAYFHIHHGEFGVNWLRNSYRSPEFFESPREFLNTDAYKVFATLETMIQIPVNPKHWQYFAN